MLVYNMTDKGLEFGPNYSSIATESTCVVEALQKRWFSHGLIQSAKTSHPFSFASLLSTFLISINVQNNNTMITVARALRTWLLLGGITCSLKFMTDRYNY